MSSYMINKKTSFVAFSCQHCPLQDKNAVNWLIEIIKERKPDEIINLGDLLEADSASKWSSEYSWTLRDEFNSANELLKRIREASPKSKLVFLEGNHDSNILSINRIDKKLRDLCDYRDESNIPELKHWIKPTEYKYSRRKGAYKIGAVTFAHGYEAGQSGDKFQAISLGQPYGLFVGGHTHRPTEGAPKQVMMTLGRPLPYWYLNTGCLRIMECDYMDRLRQDQWGQGCVVGWAENIKSPRLSKTWDAECLVYKMFNDVH